MQHKTALPNTSPCTHYFQLYHYSSEQTLDTIDPQFYGTSTLSTKKREGGLNKSYFYTIDQPESCVASGLKRRYVIYLPYEWKNMIYDLGIDPDHLYEKTKNTLRDSVKHQLREPYHYEINDAIQIQLKQAGYKGFTNSSSTLPHVVALFYPLPTKKPTEPSVIYDWSGNMIEKNKSVTNSFATKHSFFSSPIPPITELEAFTKQNQYKN